MSTLAVGASAAEKPAQPRAAKASPSMAAGVLVKTTTTAASAGLVRAAESALPRGVDLGKARKSAIGGRTTALPTSRRMTGAEAEAVAAELRGRSDVVWAAPNYIMTKSADSPVPTNDTYFVQDRVRAVWDKRSKYDTRVKAIMGSSNQFGTGGYSSRAPYAWQTTTGADQVVAVIDTGITVHPELPGWNGVNASGRILPGYDFVSQYTDGDFTEDTGRDGNGWDSNPQDEGDWTSADYCYEDAPSETSSWHGTHVAGILGAERDNSQGIVGVAPSVSILPVRVLGMCGGTTEDIIAGIRWSAGLAVGGVPLNPNPADVINLSLGGYAVDADDDFLSCQTATPAYVEAIAAARAQGAVVVAAAGNEGWSLSTHPALPATCPGVIAVGATSEYGDRAGYRNASGTKSVYSNYGSAVDISAPGGDLYWDDRGIMSASNVGAGTPNTPWYDEYIGTSMAAPVVSASAALIKSLGEFTPVETEAALKAAVLAFPTKWASSRFKPCTTSLCGKGIINLSKLPVPISGASISGDIAVGEPLTAAPGTWNALPTSLKYQWLRDDAPIPGATTTSYLVSPDDVDHRLSVRVSPATGVFAPVTATSPETVVVPDGPDVTLTGLPATAKYGETSTATVTVGGVEAGGTVELRRGSTVLGSGVTDELGVATIDVPGTSWAIGSNTIRAAYVDPVAPASSVPTVVTVAKATSSIAWTLPTKVSTSSKAKLTVQIAAPGVPANQITGTVKVFKGSTRIYTFSMLASHNGARTVYLPKITRRGTYTIKVKYYGNSFVLGKTSTSKTLKVY
ncbi:S8 family serine peptidase [Aeromicrobium sp.]|uniref:S8 family serine peptidase n=1 Tax=Aeromicrobium sp. TaxID=1871063 RepID=UPI002FC7F602